MNLDEIARMIDHTELKSSSGEKKIKDLCEEALTFNFFSVCLNPCFVKLARRLLDGSAVAVCSVVGFPLGANLSRIKAEEARIAVGEGAAEIDMVMNIGALREKQFNLVADDIAAVVAASQPALVKVILETCYLTDEEIVKACQLAVEAGARFVKTSTGFGAFGAFPDHVRLMRATVGPDIGVKASGGIKNFKDVWRLLEAGANRFGTSAGVTIIEGASLFRFAPDAWLEPEIPCHICPVRHATLAKLPKAVFAYYKKKCLGCPHRDKYNRFND
ncbi:MAG: deoxyribose-phosphate aldolase [Candidatus Cloacimonetes bacterium]|nr:deoxyribose-phosphate aldolase [Candidatus Cloacimonadota bacterium]